MDIESTMSVLALMGASWVMWLLIALSVLSIGIIAERGILLLRTRDVALWSERGGGLRALLQAGRWDEARARLSASPAPEAQVVLGVIDAPSRDVEALDQRILAESEFARLELEQFLTVLGTVGSNAPFVGLLGTVIGIVGAFHEMADSQARFSAGLMGQVGESLVATALGLVVALPAVLFYNLYQRTIRDRIACAEAVARASVALRPAVAGG